MYGTAQFRNGKGLPGIPRIRVHYLFTFSSQTSLTKEATMRQLRMVLLGVALTACGGDVTGVAPVSRGAVVYKVDALSCRGPAAIDFLLDGSVVGTETMTPGVASKSYGTTAGVHIVSAAVSVTRSRVWPSTSATVPAGGVYTAVLACV
jgi:hypothetical protein